MAPRFTTHRTRLLTHIPPSVRVLCLRSGVQMPVLAAGTWQYNDTVAADSIGKALAAGFTHIDTAENYRNQVGCGKALKPLPRDSYFLTTKTVPCEHATEAECEAQATSDFLGDLKDLGLDYVDLILLHGASHHGAGKCEAPACAKDLGQCADALLGTPPRAQRLFAASGSSGVRPAKVECCYATGRESIREALQGGKGSRDRGVGTLPGAAPRRPRRLAFHASRPPPDTCDTARPRPPRHGTAQNYCVSCFDCLLGQPGVTVVPAVNQIQYHVGMGEDPEGLVSFTEKHGIVVQAYSPLGNGKLLSDPLLKAIGAAQTPPKTSAQVALKFVVQQGYAVATKADEVEYLKEDIDVVSWNMTAAQMAKLTAATTPAGSPSWACSA